VKSGSICWLDMHWNIAMSYVMSWKVGNKDWTNRFIEFSISFWIDISKGISGVWYMTVLNIWTKTREMLLKAALQKWNRNRLLSRHLNMSGYRGRQNGNSASGE
jgi:hypothetical protein